MWGPAKKQTSWIPQKAKSGVVYKCSSPNMGLRGSESRYQSLSWASTESTNDKFEGHYNQSLGTLAAVFLRVGSCQRASPSRSWQSPQGW